MSRLRLAIADDHDVLVEGLKALFSNPDFGCDVVCTASDGAELMDQLAATPCDVVLLDLNMPGGGGMPRIAQIRERHPATRVVVFTMYDQSKFIKEAFKSGAEGYILKDSGFAELLHGLNRVWEGQIYLSEGLSVFPDTNGKAENAYEDAFLMLHSLTKRELEILTLIARAKSNKEIAEQLYISDQTVSVHRKNLMRKLKVSSSAGLIKFFVNQEMLNE